MSVRDFHGGKVVRLCREHRGITQDELARRLGVKRAAVSMLEGRELPRTETMARALSELGYVLTFEALRKGAT